jgi:hypothetical protein
LFNCQFESVSQIVDDALESAAEAQNKTSRKTNKKFKKAIDALRDYEKKCHSKETVAESMAVAEARDKRSSSILIKLKEKLREVFQVTLFSRLQTNPDPQPVPSMEEQTMTVEFHIHKYLPGSSPTIVKRKPAYRYSLQY